MATTGKVVQVIGSTLDAQFPEDQLPAIYDALVMECTAREFVNRVQNMRKEAGLEVADRIRIGVRGGDDLEQAVRQHREYIAAETLAVELETGQLPEDAILEQEWKVNGLDARIGIARSS